MDEIMRISLGLFLLAVVGGAIHELGHLTVAKMQGLNVLSYDLFGLTPHVSVSDPTLLFFAGGLLTIPIYIAVHTATFGNIYNHELAYITVGSLLGSSTDILKMLILLKLV